MERAQAASNPETKADHELVAAIGGGSQSSWGRLYERHQAGVVRFCGNFTSDSQLAEDWAQEAFTRLKEMAHTFQRGAALKPWLYKIARNICLRHRRKYREKQWSESVFARNAAALMDSGPSPATRFAGDEFNANAKALLALLNEDQRTVVILRYVENLSRKEIAEIMNVPEATVKSRLCRAMNILREQLGGDGNSSGAKA